MEGLLSGNVINKNESNYIIMIERKDCYIETVFFILKKKSKRKRGGGNSIRMRYRECRL